MKILLISDHLIHSTTVGNWRFIVNQEDLWTSMGMTFFLLIIFMFLRQILIE